MNLLILRLFSLNFIISDRGKIIRFLFYLIYEIQLLYSIVEGTWLPKRSHMADEIMPFKRFFFVIHLVL